MCIRDSVVGTQYFSQLETGLGHEFHAHVDRNKKGEGELLAQGHYRQINSLGTDLN